MQQHLQPGEIEFLLDGDEGFASHPLRKHLESCADCRARLDQARQVVERIELIADHAPSGGFADRVMARVPVFEPWYVTFAESARRAIPRGGPIRTLAAAGVALASVSLTTAAVWLALRMDVVLYVANAVRQRATATIVTGTGQFIAGTFGDAALATLRQRGLPVVLLAVTVMIGVFAVATFGLRGLIGAARRER